MEDRNHYNLRKFHETEERNYPDSKEIPNEVLKSPTEEEYSKSFQRKRICHIEGTGNHICFKLLNSKIGQRLWNNAL